jgi:hypothetical protein
MFAGRAVHQHVRAGAGSTSFREERTVPTDAHPGVFAACQRLFRDYPLAVRRHYAEFRYGSMVLVARPAATATFSVLIMERDDLFVIRPWDRRDWPRVEIRPGGQVPPATARLIAVSVPVPRDGSLLGWVAGGQVRAILAAHGRLPEPWDDPFAVPGITVFPLTGSAPGKWPPSPLTERQLWEHSARGQLADVAKLVARRTGYAFWVPTGHVVVTERMGTAECWLAAGVYAGQQALREGLAAPPARELLAAPGVTDLAGGVPQQAIAAAAP